MDPLLQSTMEGIARTFGITAPDSTDGIGPFEGAHVPRPNGEILRLLWRTNAADFLLGGFLTLLSGAGAAGEGRHGRLAGEQAGVIGWDSGSTAVPESRHGRHGRLAGKQPIHVTRAIVIITTPPSVAIWAQSKFDSKLFSDLCIGNTMDASAYWRARRGPRSPCSFPTRAGQRPRCLLCCRPRQWAR